jgi:hypothetical protein
MNLCRLKRGKKLSRAAVSEIIGAVILLGATILVGLVAFAWARGAAANSESNFGNAVGSNINYLKENFVIVNVNFSSTAPKSFTEWIYNAGNVTAYIKQVWASNSTWNSGAISGLNSTYTSKFSCYCLVIHAQTLSLITVQGSASFVSGDFYKFSALGVYGNTNTYQQAR